MRALLPSIKALPIFRWDTACESCFRDVQAPYLTAFEIVLDPGEDVSSWSVFKGLLTVQSIVVRSNSQLPFGGAVLQSATEALRRGFLQSLQRLQLNRFTAGDEDIRDFTYALEGSGCATRMVSLCFDGCGMGFEAARSVAELLGRAALPALKKLWSDKRPGITDEGVVVLAEALLNVPQTSLEDFCLKDVGMGDKGLIALASVVYHGRFEHLIEMSIS